MEAPRVTGERLALVVGSGMTGVRGRGPLPKGEPPTLRVAGSDGEPREVQIFDAGTHVVVLRHGDPPVPAHLVDHHANIRAMCEAGCGRVLALASVGSLRADWGVGTVVAPDDFLAPWVNPTYYSDTRGHSIPGFAARWRATVVERWKHATSTPILDGGTYAQTTGPRFETPAEIRLLANYADLVGMTIAAEVVLAGEAGLEYAAVCKVDNLANGIAGDSLTMETYQRNTTSTRQRFLDDLSALLKHLGGSA